MAFVATVSVAGAWSRKCDEAVMIIASEHLTPEAGKVVKKYLGKSFADDVQYLYDTERVQFKQMSKKDRKAAAEIHFLHLDSEFQPKNVKGKDALKATEQALEIIRNRNSHSKAEVTTALRTVINLMCDMHNLSNVALEEFPLSGTNFEFMMTKGSARGKGGKLIPYRWKVLWTYRYPGFHAAYSPEMWAEELDVMFGSKKAELSAGTLREWVGDIGNYSKPIYARLYKDNNHFLHATIHSYDLFSMSCVGKASYRLAALLNETLK